MQIPPQNNPESAVTCERHNEVIPKGDWLWGKLIAWCNKRRLAPAYYNDLFSIVGEARQAAVLAELTVEPEPWMRDVYAWLKSTCPEGAAEEAFRTAPASIRHALAAPHASPTMRSSVGVEA